MEKIYLITIAGVGATIAITTFFIMGLNYQEPIKHDVSHDELSTRRVTAFVIPAREIIPERTCHKFTEIELKQLPDDLTYVIDEAIRSIREYDDYDGFYSGFGNWVDTKTALEMISMYDFTLTKKSHYDNLNKLGDTSYRFECFFEDEKYQYKIGFDFEPFSYSASKVVFVNITKNNGNFVVENSNITIFTGGFNQTVLFQNKLDEPVKIVFQNKFSEDSEWARNPPQKVTIPPNWKWSHFFVNLHSGEDLNYDYVVKPLNVEGKINLKNYPRCMIEGEVKSLYSQVGAYPKFPSYLPEGYSFECGVHNSNGFVHLVYFTDDLRKKFDDKVNAAFNFDFFEAGGLRVDYYNGYILNNFNETSEYDKLEKFQENARQARATSYTIGGEPAVLLQEFFWRDGEQKSFNKLKIFSNNEIRYTVTSGLPETEIIKIAESLD